MNTILQNISQKQVAIFGCLVIIISLVYSPFVLSMGMIIVLATAVLDMEKLLGEFKLKKHPQLHQNFQDFKNQPIFLVLTIYFFLVLIGGLYSSDLAYWFSRLKMKLPFLLLPFAVYSIPSLSRRDYLGLYYFLVIVLSVTCMGIGINYLLNFEAINDMIHRGQSMPVPRNHIRYSLLMAIGVIAGGYLYVEKFIWKYNWERWLILGMTLFLLFFIHVLSVRSGLLVLYLSILILAILYIYQSRRFAVGFAVLGFVFALPMMAYWMIPSFQTKVNYVRYDLLMHQHDKGENYSDSERIRSLQMGWEVAQSHPIMGVGSGDLKQAMRANYQSVQLDETAVKMPHNQLLSVWAGSGLIGLLVFLTAFFYPLFHKKNYLQPLFLSLHIIIFASFIMENTLENSMGVGIYIFWVLMGVKYLEGVSE